MATAFSKREHGLERATEAQIDKLHAKIGQLFVVTLKGAGRVYQHAFVDAYSKVVQAKLNTTKAPITAGKPLSGNGSQHRILSTIVDHPLIADQRALLNHKISVSPFRISEFLRPLFF